MNFDRRTFLRTSLSASLAGVACNSAFGQLQLLQAAGNLAPKVAATDYRALVCVFLNGGNDSVNTLVPFDPEHYGIYAATRPVLALPQTEIAARALNPLARQDGRPGGAPSDGAQYGVHPAFAPMQHLFNTRRAAIIANVGTLLGPISKSEYRAGTSGIPPLLFSHDDQANAWQASVADQSESLGWGGRMVDLLHAGNPNPRMPMAISMSGQSLFHRGRSVDQYVMNAQGVRTLDYLNPLNPYQNEASQRAKHSLMASGIQTHMFERAVANATRRSISTYQLLEAAMRNLPHWEMPFPKTSLGAQLQQVANVISARQTLGLRRQVFYVSMGGFDTHDEQLLAHPALLASLSQALNSFYLATEQMGIAQQVTAFTASDFGRSLSSNGDGSDHGWGGHHFVVGGAVRGGRFYGKMPSLRQHDNPDDTGYGQLIPTTGVDPYSATLAAWFGIEQGPLRDIFPHLHRFPEADLGFMESA